MGFTINQMIVNGDSKVVALDWVYTNADGSLKDQHRLLEPYGDVPLSKVTAEVASFWLMDQLPNEPAEFDAELARRKAAEAEAAAVTAYDVHPVKSPTVVEGPADVLPEPEPEPEVEVEITPEVSTMPVELDEPEATTQPAPAKRTRRKKKAD